MSLKKQRIIPENEVEKPFEEQCNHMGFHDVPEAISMGTPTQIINPKALKVVLIYGLISLLLFSLFSETVLGLLPIQKSIVAIIVLNKTWLLLLLMAPFIYWQINQFTSFYINRNRQLARNEKKLIRLIRVHSMLSQINHAILRQRDTEQLLYEVCQIVLKEGDYSFVWAGLCEIDGILPEVLVSDGLENNYLQDLFDGYISSSASERQEPALSALRKKHSVVINDIHAFSKNQLSWQMRAIQNGYRSIVAFPLKTNAGQSGVLALYSNQINAFSQDEINIFRALTTDINMGLSEIEQKNKLFYLANYDVMTNLPNRALFEDRVQQSIAYAQQENRILCVAVIRMPDLDVIIEKMGQDAADKILKKAGEHLGALVRSGDTVGLMGHNEIGILLTGLLNGNEIPNMMQKMLSTFNVTYFHEEREICLQAGVAVFPQDGDNCSVLLKHAKEVLHQINREPDIHCAYFSKEMASEVRNNQKIKQEIQGAIDKGEFHLYYQPIIDLQTKKVVGVEALTRWPNHNLGEVSPKQFLPVVEELGLMMPLGRWILKTACVQFLKWKKPGLENLFLAVNLSLKQLEHPQFIEELTSLFKEIQFDPKEHQLCFEVTERTLVKDIKTHSEILTTLREMGLNIFIDDYGTDAASLSDLHQLPVDVLKIDTMFVRAIGKNENADLLIKGILALAKGLSMGTIAEGVETEHQLKILQKLGCKMAQGYFFSPPVVAKNVETLFGKSL